MKVNSSTFLCTLPLVTTPPPTSEDNTTTALSHAEEEKERLRARKKGWELLRPLEGNCMFVNTGWWTYAFCHDRYVKQFHALAPGNQVPVYPPVEDPATESFYLGQTHANERHSDAELYGSVLSQLDEGLTSVDALGEQRYLVQKMEGGTWCELIKKNRKIEIQFQCDPSGGDRIAWIKETSTCSYVMVIHTPRLCNDLAFVPATKAEGEGAYEIVCQKVATEEIDPGRQDAQPKQPVLELPPAAKTTEEAMTMTEKPKKTPEENVEKHPNAADFLEFVVPFGSLPSALSLLEETITKQIADGQFLRPDGAPYDPDDEESIEYHVELIDNEENQVFGALKVKISKGAKVEAEILQGDKQADVLPESLRKELKDWVEGRIIGQAEESDDEKQDN